VKSQVTTKRGDSGTTTTITGETLSKSHAIFECCGQIDALRAHTALCRLLVLESGHAEAARIAEFLHWLLHVYFAIGSQCNDPRNAKPEFRRVDVGPEHLAKLEAHQAEFEARVKLPRQFVLSAATMASAQLDIACTTARAAERSIVRLKEAVPEFEAGQILAFINRLSDTLFMLARWMDGGAFTTVDYRVLGVADSRNPGHGKRP
jgi:cob(I)alamin adenosyltransferase